MVETRSPRPVLLEVDDDAPALAKIERELSDRYGKGYCVACEASAEVGIEALRVESGLGPRGDHKSDQGPNRIGPCAPCACSRAGL